MANSESRVQGLLIYSNEMVPCQFPEARLSEERSAKRVHSLST